MFTHSGIQVVPGEGVPSLEDIAVALGRICRFAGNCRQFWPVLLHSIAVWQITKEPHCWWRVPFPDLRVEGTHIFLYALLHDASEAVLGDITRPFKTPDIKKIEKDIEFKIYKSMGFGGVNNWKYL